MGCAVVVKEWRGYWGQRPTATVLHSRCMNILHRYLLPSLPVAKRSSAWYCCGVIGLLVDEQWDEREGTSFKLVYFCLPTSSYSDRLARPLPVVYGAETSSDPCKEAPGSPVAFPFELLSWNITPSLPLLLTEGVWEPCEQKHSLCIQANGWFLCRGGEVPLFIFVVSSPSIKKKSMHVSKMKTDHALLLWRLELSVFIVVPIVILCVITSVCNVAAAVMELTGESSVAFL